MQKTIEQMQGNQFVGGKEAYKYHHPMSPNEVSGFFCWNVVCRGESLCLAKVLDKGRELQ